MKTPDERLEALLECPVAVWEAISPDAFNGPHWRAETHYVAQAIGTTIANGDACELGKLLMPIAKAYLERLSNDEQVTNAYLKRPEL